MLNLRPRSHIFSVMAGFIRRCCTAAAACPGIRARRPCFAGWRAALPVLRPARGLAGVAEESGRVGEVHALPVAEGYELPVARRCLASSSTFAFAELHAELRSGALRAVHTAPCGRVGHAFVFARGTVVGWNLEEATLQQLRRELEEAQVNPYAERLVEAEREVLDCYRGTTPATVVDDEGVWMPSGDADLSPSVLDAFAISHGLAMSVQLGVFELEMQDYAAAFTWVLRDVREAKRIRISRDQVLQHTGQLLYLRHKWVATRLCYPTGSPGPHPWLCFAWPSVPRAPRAATHGATLPGST